MAANFARGGEEAYTGCLVLSDELARVGADLDALLNGPASRIVSPAEPVVLVGHSMGAAVAAAYARLRPGRVTALALIDGLMPAEPRRCGR